MYDIIIPICRTSPDGKETTVETEERYIERMGGILSVYAAITTIQIRSIPNPHSIEHAWMWFSRVLNMKPNKYTASILHAFLEVAGYRCLQVYGKQFARVLSFIKHRYMIMMLAMDQEDLKWSRPAISRLMIYLQEYEKTGRLEQPKGVIQL